ncbi:hypothetical protein ACRRTK_021168 [Alexandromys fortis]
MGSVAGNVLGCPWLAEQRQLRSKSPEDQKQDLCEIRPKFIPKRRIVKGLKGSNVGRVSSKGSNVGRVSSRRSNIGRVSSMGSNVGRVSNMGSNVGRVSSTGSNVGRVSSTGSNVGRVSNMGSNVGRVSSTGSNIGRVSSMGSNVGRVSNMGSNVGRVSSTGSNVGRVSSMGSNLGSVSSMEVWDFSEGSGDELNFEEQAAGGEEPSRREEHCRHNARILRVSLKNRSRDLKLDVPQLLNVLRASRHQLEKVNLANDMKVFQGRLIAGTLQRKLTGRAHFPVERMQSNYVEGWGCETFTSDHQEKKNEMMSFFARTITETKSGHGKTGATSLIKAKPLLNIIQRNSASRLLFPEALSLPRWKQMVAEQQQQEEIYYGAIEIDERPSHSTDSNRSSENRNGLFVKNEPAVSPNQLDLM